MIASKTKIILLLISVMVALIAGAALIPQDEVVIQSMESKTQEGHPVFNKISLKTGNKTDIWTMKQSHYGFHAQESQWDTIRILVDKEKKLVRFQQLRNNQEIELKAACYTCHANGPRAIRPDYESKDVSYTWKDKLNIKKMNFRMKAYGRLKVADDNFKLNKKFREVPLKFFGKRDQEILAVKSCTLCHNSDTFWGRGELQRQHAGTIKHLVKSGQMPPWPFRISDEDQVKLDRFVKGF